MNLFKRISNLMKKPEPPKPEKTIHTAQSGDFVEVSLVMYEIIGKTTNLMRNEAMLTLKDGKDIRYLYTEKREKPTFILYTEIDGRLDSYHEVPSTITLEDTKYYLEEQYNGRSSVQGNTAFPSAGEQSVWLFQSDDRKYLRIEWQDGRFMFYEGEDVLSGDIDFLQGKE
ncbi:DUF4178 domain-containing protein [Chengkuizengella axinellae]|uniref:DUF4178 domain-containing protein n=1 Tax=Chengkuizengella axinellae TaxID=3064388 RepID=A0ABT9IZ54_9BACL|nr:DUF4178 domain-containing protein [Chengkuizengella sp. 2205SS18-9]MDP5274651.1 DUF4178 domain-containing protein [Chengkuizengella sp. 2205SS18-9]